MKKTLIAVLLAGGTLAASAQSIVNNPDNQSYFGIRASLDIACPGDIKNGVLSVDLYRPGAGFSAGAIYNLPLVANLYFEPGVNLFYNTYLLDDVETSWNGEGKVSGSIRKFGMRVPLQFGYHFDFTPDVSLAVFTGPELEAGFAGKSHMTVKAGNLKETDSESIYGDDGMSRFDCLWKFGAGVTVNRNYYIGVSGGIGLCNMSGDSDVKFHENLVQLTLGYNF